MRVGVNVFDDLNEDFVAHAGAVASRRVHCLYSLNLLEMK